MRSVSNGLVQGRPGQHNVHAVPKQQQHHQHRCHRTCAVLLRRRLRRCRPDQLQPLRRRDVQGQRRQRGMHGLRGQQHHCVDRRTGVDGVPVLGWLLRPRRRPLHRCVSLHRQAMVWSCPWLITSSPASPTFSSVRAGLVQDGRRERHVHELPWQQQHGEYGRDGRGALHVQRRLRGRGREQLRRVRTGHVQEQLGQRRLHGVCSQQRHVVDDGGARGHVVPVLGRLHWRGWRALHRYAPHERASLDTRPHVFNAASWCGAVQPARWASTRTALAVRRARRARATATRAPLVRPPWRSVLAIPATAAPTRPAARCARSAATRAHWATRCARRARRPARRRRRARPRSRRASAPRASPDRLVAPAQVRLSA